MSLMTDATGRMKEWKGGGESQVVFVHETLSWEVYEISQNLQIDIKFCGSYCFLHLSSKIIWDFYIGLWNRVSHSCCLHRKFMPHVL